MEYLSSQNSNDKALKSAIFHPPTTYGTRYSDHHLEQMAILRDTLSLDFNLSWDFPIFPENDFKTILHNIKLMTTSDSFSDRLGGFCESRTPISIPQLYE